MSPSGKKITQSFIKNLVTSKEVILICGRYEGIDQRFIDFCSNIEEDTLNPINYLKKVEMAEAYSQQFPIHISSFQIVL